MLQGLDDLRRLYSDPAIIADRQKRSVCRTDSELVVEFRRDVSVSTNSTLNEVLHSIGVTNRDGTKQIRIIKQNAILQNPSWRQATSDAWEQFSNTKIQPADIIIVCTSRD
ncbi:MAG TPA: hypothetical protein VFZ59_03440 [Verrucomicrobiae bacterium]|nr:hypothetical protein [Verrucomicrobiae bacterium]